MKHSNIRKLAAIFMLTSLVFSTVSPALAGSGTVINSNSGTIAPKTGDDAGDYSTSMGCETNASGFGSTSMGYETTASGFGSTAMNVATIAKGKASFAGGGDIEMTTPGYALPIAGGAAYGTSSFAFGIGAVAGDASDTSKGMNAISMGYQTTASGAYAVSLGYQTNASALSSTSMGYQTNASGFGSTSMGYLTTSSGKYSTSMGYGTTASGEASFAMGDRTVASGKNSIALGFWACATNNQSVAMGLEVCATGTQSVAMGHCVCASGSQSVAMGHGTNAVGDRSFAMGDDTNAAGNYSFAGGYQSKAYEVGSFAFGNNAVAGVEGCYSGGQIAMGKNAKATHANSVALGNNAETKTAQSVQTASINDTTYTFDYTASQAEGVVSVGSNGHLKQIINVANGRISCGSTDVVNGGQIYDIINNLSSGGGSGGGAFWSAGSGYGSITIPSRYNSAEGYNAISLGENTTAGGYCSTAMGAGTSASGSYSTAMGSWTNASGECSTAMGERTNASGNYSTAMGYMTTSSGYSTLSMGYQSCAAGNGSFAGGGYKITNNKYAKGSNAYGNNSFAFGAGAVAGRIVTPAVEEVRDEVSGDIITPAQPAVYGGDNTIAFGNKAVASTDNAIALGSMSLSAEAKNAYYGAYMQGVLKGEITNEIVTYYFSGPFASLDLEALKAMSVEEFTAAIDSFLATMPGGMTCAILMEQQAKVSLPDGTTASGENAIAIGNSLSPEGTIASGKNSIAFGNDAKATHDNSVALGSYSVTSAANTISVGYAGGERRITNVAEAVGDTDAVNFGQMKDYVETHGGSGSGGGDDANAVHYNADKTEIALEGSGGTTIKNVKAGTENTDAVNFGQMKDYVAEHGGSGSSDVISGKTSEGAKAAEAKADDAVAIASNSAVSEQSAAGIAIGKGATVGYKDGDPAKEDTKAISGIAIGENSRVEGEKSTAIGYGNIVTGKASGAFGDPNKVTGNASYAFGNNNEIAGANNFVLGNEVKIGADVTNSVALGNKSEVKESNVVSVGSSAQQRRIVNVADGINPTDAANMRQLNAVRNELGSVANEIKEVGAISAALAGLHYAEPSGEEGDKFVGAVAYGNYRGESAGAIGVAYKPSPNLMMSASTSVGNDQNAYNAGVSFKFGKGETAKTRAELQKQVKYLNEKNQAQDAENAALKEKIAAQDEEIKALKEGLEELKKLIKK